jgi:tetratricopeptide (TPR) repeat protein
MSAGHSGAKTGAAFRERGWEPVVIVLAVMVAYAGSLHGPFVFDDNKSIVTNQSLRQWSTAWSPPSDLGVVGRPVLNVSLAINYLCGGADVVGYHLVNLLIHLLAALTLYAGLRRSWPRGEGRAAFWAALLWALHPVQTSSVTYVIQRAECLMGLFYLLTVYAFIRYCSGRRIGWAAASAGACALGMGTKEVMVTAPLVVLLYDRACVSGSFGAAFRRHGTCHAALAATWAILAGLMSQAPARGIGYGYGVSASSYALTESKVVVRYLGLAVWPFPLVLDYNLPVLRHWAEAAPFLLILAALLAAWFWSFRRAPRLAFVGAIFFVILAPTSSIVPVALQPMAENRLYLPVLAVVVLLVAALQRWLPRGTAAAGTVLAVVWGGATFARNTDYRTEEGLWAGTVKRVPANARAWYNLGSVQLRAGRTAAAVDALRHAAQIDPCDHETRYNLGIALAGMARWPESVEEYQAALRTEPHSAAIENNLGIALLHTSGTDAAIAAFAAAASDDPRFAAAEGNWGNALYQAHQPAEAARHLAVAAQLAPNVPLYHVRLAMALAQAGNPAAAIEQFESALRLNPGDETTRANLEMLRRATGQSTAAP